MGTGEDRVDRNCDMRRKVLTIAPDVMGVVSMCLGWVMMGTGPGIHEDEKSTLRPEPKPMFPPSGGGIVQAPVGCRGTGDRLGRRFLPRQSSPSTGPFPVCPARDGEPMRTREGNRGQGTG